LKNIQGKPGLDIKMNENTEAVFRPILHNLRGSPVTFLIGDAGPLALACVVVYSIQGLAGTAYFLHNLQDPANAKFPAYAL